MKTFLVIATALACAAARPNGSDSMPESWMEGMESLIQGCEELGYMGQKNDNGMESVPQSWIDGCEMLHNMVQGNFPESWEQRHGSESEDMPESWMSWVEGCEELGLMKNGMESVPQSWIDGCEMLQGMAEGNFPESWMKKANRGAFLCQILTALGVNNLPAFCPAGGK